MRVLIINTFPVWGGDEKWTVNIAKGLMDRGHYVLVACPGNSQTEQKAKGVGLPTHALHIGLDIAFWKIPSLIKLLKAQKIDIVVGVQNRDMKIGGLSARLARIPAIFGRQGLDTIKNKFDHKIVFTKFLDGIITNTRSIKQLYESYKWFPEKFIHVVYDGMTLPDQLTELDLHQEFNLIPESKVIIGTGRLARQKRFDLLIKMASMAKAEQLNWSIIIAGTGELENDLKAMIIKYNVEDMVKLIGFREDVLALMNSSDLFVLSSDSEGMSNALREAMAVGKACVATDVFGVEELFENGKSGIKVPKGDAQAIYIAVKSIFFNPELKRRIENSAKQIIQSKFTMNGMIDQIEHIFEDQLAKA